MNIISIRKPISIVISSMIILSLITSKVSALVRHQTFMTTTTATSSASKKYMINNSKQKHLVLVGGGHAHIQVIKALNKYSRPSWLKVTLIDVQSSASYSGMVPGCVCKYYKPEQTLLHLKPLADWADIHFIQDKVVDIDLENKLLYTQQKEKEQEVNGQPSYNNKESSGGEGPLSFDCISLDIGSTSRGFKDTIGAKEYTIPTRPISKLVERIDEAEQDLLALMKQQSTTKTTLKGDDAAAEDGSTLDVTNFKPEDLMTKPEEQCSTNSASDVSPHVVVIGGGAAGIELSLSMMGRWKPIFPNTKVTLINAGSELIPEETQDCQNALFDIMKERGIEIRHNSLVKQITDNDIVLTTAAGKNEQGKILDQDSLSYTHCIWATGAGAHPLAYKLKEKGLQCTEHGWFTVNEYLQSTSHPYIFAAGDCCSIQKSDGSSPPPKAGVYAVRSGPILIDNLTNFLQQERKREHDNNDQDNSSTITTTATSLTKYEPQKEFLKLLVCGNGKALGFRFGLPLYGQWVWQMKDSIDQSFMSLFKKENLPNLQDATPYDKSQYDANWKRDGYELLPPSEAATLLLRTDDDVNYEDTWMIIRIMAENESYRNEVVEQAKQKLLRKSLATTSNGSSRNETISEVLR